MRPIIQKIVVAESLPWEGKAELGRALVVRQSAAGLARLLKAGVELLYAEDMDSSYFRDMQILPLLEAQEKRLAKLAKGLGPKAKALVKPGQPVAVILGAAKARVLLVMGTHGRKGMDRMVLGSVAEEVVRHAACPVMVLGPKAQSKAVKFPARLRLLLATDLQPEGRKAQEFAFSLAKEARAHLTLFSFLSESVPIALPAEAFGVLGAYPLPVDLKPMRQAKALRLKHLAEIANRAGISCDYQLEEKSLNAAQSILKGAKGHQVIIMGKHARGSLQAALLGSTARKVILESVVPVIIVNK